MVIPASDLALAMAEQLKMLYDSTCAVYRTSASTSNSRFGHSTTESVVSGYESIPCSVQHKTLSVGLSNVLADRLAGRIQVNIYMPRDYVVLDNDRIKVHGGDTYEVIAPPHLDGPDDPALTIIAAAVTPVVTNA